MTGLKTTQTNTQKKTEKKIDEPVMSNFSEAGPTLQSQAAWLDTFLETEKSIRTVTMNLYLHNSTRNNNEIAEEINTLLYDPFFDTEDFRILREATDTQIRNRVIKNLLLAVQIQLDAKPTAITVRTLNNKNIEADLKLLNSIAKDRDDINLNGLNLDCSGTSDCLDYFNTEFNKIR